MTLCILAYVVFTVAFALGAGKFCAFNRFEDGT